MAIEVECPKCGGLLRLEESFAGKQVECTECGSPMMVPEVEQKPEEGPAARAPGVAGHELTFEQRMALAASRIKRERGKPFTARHPALIFVVVGAILVGVVVWNLPWLIQRLQVQGDISLLESTNRPQRYSGARHIVEVANPTAVPALIHYLKDEDAVVRGCCARALGKVGDPRADAALIEALEDEVVSVRCEAAWALATCGTAEAKRPLRAVADSPDSSDLLRTNARYALYRLGDADQFEELTRALTDGEHASRRAAVEALGEIGRKDAIPFLEKAVSGNPVEVKVAIGKAIDKLKREGH